MKKFRINQPKCTYSGLNKANYRDYRPYIREDYNRRCAYTDCSDVWWQDGFHIDHFAPMKPDIVDKEKKAKFLELKNEYRNLVYACPQINRAKGNDWPSEDPGVSQLNGKGYINPRKDFNKYFERTDTGGIVHKDHPIAKYMWEKLRLYLVRYELYWRMEQIDSRIDKLNHFHKTVTLPAELKKEACKQLSELLEEYSEYKKYLDTHYQEIIR